MSRSVADNRREEGEDAEEKGKAPTMEEEDGEGGPVGELLRGVRESVLTGGCRTSLSRRRRDVWTCGVWSCGGVLLVGRVKGRGVDE